MDEKRYRITRLWRPSKASQPWFVIFDLAEIDGRLDCVGVSVRSYDDVSWPDDANVERWMPVSDMRLEEDQGASYTRVHGASADEGEVLFQQFAFPLRPLNTTILRKLPFASLLAGSRPQTARDKREGAAITEASLRRWLDARTGEPAFSDEKIAEIVEKDEAEAKALERPGTRRGAPAKYDNDYLAKVAHIYTTAFPTRPTLAVARELGCDTKRAAKLVWLARRRGFLGPTSPGVAGGVEGR